jgi:hypothetical protein
VFVAVAPGTGVAVSVAVGTGVAVSVAVGTGVLVLVAVGAGVFVFVAVGAGVLVRGTEVLVLTGTGVLVLTGTGVLVLTGTAVAPGAAVLVLTGTGVLVLTGTDVFVLTGTGVLVLAPGTEVGASVLLPPGLGKTSLPESILTSPPPPQAAINRLTAPAMKASCRCFLVLFCIEMTPNGSKIICTPKVGSAKSTNIKRRFAQFSGNFPVQHT